MTLTEAAAWSWEHTQKYRGKWTVLSLSLIAGGRFFATMQVEGSCKTLREEGENGRISPIWFFVS